MTTNLLFRRTPAPVVIGIALAAVLGSRSTAWAQAAPLVGVWHVTVQGRDCVTNTALGPPTRDLFTYHQDGTVLASTGATVFAPGQRSSGHGTWSHTGGATFTERVLGLLLFDTPPNSPPPLFLAGWQIIFATITISGADQFTATGGAQFYDLNRQLYRSGCATRVGERFK